MSFTLTINFYEDIWAADDAGDTIRSFDVKAGDIVSLPAAVRDFAPHGATWATMYINDTWVASFKRDIETLEWKEVHP